MNKQNKAIISLILGTLALLFSAFKLCTEFQEYNQNYAEISGENYTIPKEQGNEWIYLGEEK